MSATTATTGAGFGAMTREEALGSIHAAIRAIEELGEEPIGAWMREQGFPPERHFLVLPDTMRKPGQIVPDYVKFSVLIQEPLIIRNPPF